MNTLINGQGHHTEKDFMQREAAMARECAGSVTKVERLHMSIMGLDRVLEAQTRLIDRLSGCDSPCDPTNDIKQPQVSIQQILESSPDGIDDMVERALVNISTIHNIIYGGS